MPFVRALQPRQENQAAAALDSPCAHVQGGPQTWNSCEDVIDAVDFVERLDAVVRKRLVVGEADSDSLDGPVATHTGSVANEDAQRREACLLRRTAKAAGRTGATAVAAVGQT